MSYISHEDYKNLISCFQADTSKGILKEAVEEGNAFTAALAKTKKGDKFQIGGKEITDTSGYDDPSVKEYGYADNYPGSRGYREGKEVDDDSELVDLITRYTKDDPEKLAGMDPQAWPDHVLANLERDKDYQAYKQKHQKEGLNPAPLQATGPTISTVEEDYMEPFKLPKRTDTSKLDYDPDASRFEPDYMKAAGEEDDDEDEENFDFDEDDIISSSDDISKSFKKSIARDKERYPFLRENQASYSFSTLSPDENKQLSEYIDSIKTIKKEIAKLATKAGKKVKAEGGDMTGRTMNRSVTSEASSNEKIKNIEKKISEKLYSASEKIIKHLRKSGLTPGEIKMFLNHETEEMAKKAADAQYDLEENEEGIDKKKVLAQNLKVGDIVRGTGEKVLKVTLGARAMNGRLDMSKVTVDLERTKKDGTKATRAGLWKKNTLIGVDRAPGV